MTPECNEKKYMNAWIQTTVINSQHHSIQKFCNITQNADRTTIKQKNSFMFILIWSFLSVYTITPLEAWTCCRKSSNSTCIKYKELFGFLNLIFTLLNQSTTHSTKQHYSWIMSQLSHLRVIIFIIISLTK